MILYLDTSSLVKLYVEEDGAEDVRRLVGQATVVATSVVAYRKHVARSHAFTGKVERRTNSTPP